MYDEFSQAEVLIGMAECLSQSLAGAALSPDTIKAVLGAVTSGLALDSEQIFPTPGEE